MKKAASANIPLALIKVFKGLFYAVTIGLFISLCFFNNATYVVDTVRQLAYAAILILAILGLSVLLRRLWQNDNRQRVLRRAFPAAVFVGLVLLFVWQVIMASHISKPIGWDVARVVTAAVGYVYDKTEYFTLNPHNLFLMFVLRGVYRVLTWFNVMDLWLALSVFNTFVVDMAFLLAILLARKAYGTGTAYAALGLTILLLSLFPWIIVPYSDTLSMPFVIGTLCCYAAACRAGRMRARILWGLAMAVSLAVGVLLKPTVLGILVAIVLMHVLYTLAEPGRKGPRLTWLVPALATAAVLFFSVQSLLYAQTYIPIERGKSMPPSHYMSMGMTQYSRFYGAYNDDDVAFTLQYETTEAMDAANRQRIREKLEDRGALGTLRYLVDKARWIMAEGTFTWGFDGNFADAYTRPQSLFTDLFFRLERYHEAYLHMAQAIWIVVFGLMTSLAFTDRMNVQNRCTTMMQCGIFGLLLYLLLFEARARYLINYLPLFVLLAAHGYARLMQATLPFGRRDQREAR